MENKTNISKKKVVRFLIGAVLICLFGGLLFASSYMHRNSKVKDINITLSDAKVMLMSKEEYKSILTANEISNYENIRIKDLNLEEIEGILESSPWIRKAEAYIDNNQILQLDIIQNIPAARIFTNTGSNFLIDTALNLLPVNTTMPIAVPVFTNVPQLSEDEQSLKYKANIAYLGYVIASDSFWNAQITQIDMLPNGNFELLTLMGNHKVIFGDTTRAADKLNNLFLFYKKALARLGWDKYNTIDIRYKGQVVTSPAMGYIAPIIEDTAIDLPDPDDGEAPVSHEPQVLVSDDPIQNGNNSANIVAAKATPITAKDAPEKPAVTTPASTNKPKQEPKRVENKPAAKAPAKKTEVKKVGPKKQDPKKSTPAKGSTAPVKPATKQEDKSKSQQKPKHLLPGKNK